MASLGSITLVMLRPSSSTISFYLNEFNNFSFTVSRVFFLVLVFTTMQNYKKHNFSILACDRKNPNKRVKGILKNTKTLVLLLYPQKFQTNQSRVTSLKFQCKK